MPLVAGPHLVLPRRVVLRARRTGIQRRRPSEATGHSHDLVSECTGSDSANVHTGTPLIGQQYSVVARAAARECITTFKLHTAAHKLFVAPP